MTEPDKLLFSPYTIDGVQMALSPARMLRECTLEPPLEPDGTLPTLADEHLDPSPGNFDFREGDIARYMEEIAALKRTFPVPFAGPYTAGKVAQALIDAIWMSGHFRLGDLTLRAEWKWSDKGVGLLAAFYGSVESACNYIDSLGTKISRYSVLKGNPSVSFKASTIAEEDQVDEEESLFRELPYRTANPRISRRRKCPAALIPDQSDWLIFIPFDTCDFRLGGSALTEALGTGNTIPSDVGDADYFIDCYEVVRELVEDGVVKAGVTVGEGGLAMALKTLTQQGTGAKISVDDVCKAYTELLPVRVLFAEVPGVVVQIADIDYDYVDAELLLQDVAYFPIGHPTPGTGGLQLSPKASLPGILESLLNTLEGED